MKSKLFIKHHQNLDMAGNPHGNSVWKSQIFMLLITWLQNMLIETDMLITGKRKMVISKYALQFYLILFTFHANMEALHICLTHTFLTVSYNYFRNKTCELSLYKITCDN